LSLTAEQVLALAPDPASAAAGRKLGARKPWRALGRSARALWGECQGSAVYQVRVDLSDFSTKCSCPSRKFPCKHALGLLFLTAAEASALPAAGEPEWVTDWLAKREETTARRETKKEAKAAAEADPKAREERAEKRLERIGRGIEGLDLWLEDLVRNGLVLVEGQPSSFWERQAARLVDAQAPGLAARVRRLAHIPGSGLDWPETLLGEIGRLALLTHAFRRLDALEPALREDVRRLVGFTLSQEEVTASGERVSDCWRVLGQVTEDEERVRSQRTWLLGEASGRAALILQFAVGDAAFPALYAPGSRFVGDLAFWPSAWPQRALVVERRDAGPEAAGGMGSGSIAAFLSATADALARQPWLDRFPCLLRDVVPAPAPAVEGKDRFRLLDREGKELPLVPADPWRLLALSGGRPLDLTGEWDGAAVTPLGAFVGGDFFPMGRLS
jgi:hypothetical protein